MSKIYFRKEVPTSDSLMQALQRDYPSADLLCLFTHQWMRTIGLSIDDIVDSYLSRHGISSGRFILLTTLEVAPKEGLKPSQLATQLGVTQATVTGLIDGLESSNWVKRKSDPRDRRACVVVLTERGRQFIGKVRPEFHQWLSTVYNVWDASEKRQLVSLIERFCQSLKASLNETDPPVTRVSKTAKRTTAPRRGGRVATRSNPR